MKEIRCKVEKQNKINGIFLGIATVMNFVVGSVSDYTETSNLFPVAMILLGIIAAITNILQGQVKWRISVKELIFYAIFGVQVLIGMMIGFSDNSLYYALCFFCIGIPSLFLATRKIDYDILRHTVLVIGMVSIPHFFSIMSMEYTAYTSGEQMGSAYSIVAMLFIASWTLLDSDDKVIWKGFSGLIIGLSLIILVRVMTRGAWLCVFAFAGYLLWKKTSGKKFIVLALFFSPLIVWLGYYIFNIFLVDSEWYYHIFSMKSGNLLNGRNYLWENVFSYRGLWEMLVGTGIGSYYGMYGTYPHNVLAQIYYDQGLITLGITMFVLVSGARNLIYNAKHGRKADYYLVLVICAGFAKLMVSSYFWIEQLFWIMLGLMLTRDRNKVIWNEEQQKNE